MASPQRLHRSTHSIPPRQPITQTVGKQGNTLPKSAFHMTQSNTRDTKAHDTARQPPRLTPTPIVRMTPVDYSHLDYKCPDTPPPGPPVSPQLRGMILLDNDDDDNINNNSTAKTCDGADSLASGLSEENLGYLAAELERVASIVEMDSKTKTERDGNGNGSGSGSGDGDGNGDGDGDGEIGFWRWVRGVRCLGRGKVEDGIEEEGKEEGEQKVEVEVEGQHKLRKVVWTT